MLFGSDKERQHLINNKILSSERKSKSPTANHFWLAQQMRNTHWKVINFAVSFKTDVKDINSLATDIRFYENAIIYNCTMINKHQKEIKLFKHLPVRPFWKLKIFFSLPPMTWLIWPGLMILILTIHLRPAIVIPCGLTTNSDRVNICNVCEILRCIS